MSRNRRLLPLLALSVPAAGCLALTAAGALFVGAGSWFYYSSAPEPVAVNDVAGAGSSWVVERDTAGEPRVDRSLSVSELPGILRVLQPMSLEDRYAEYAAGLQSAPDEFARREYEERERPVYEARLARERADVVGKQVTVRLDGSVRGEYDFNRNVWYFDVAVRSAVWEGEYVVVGRASEHAERRPTALVLSTGPLHWTKHKEDERGGTYVPVNRIAVPMGAGEASARKDLVRSMNHVDVLLVPTGEVVNDLVIGVKLRGMPGQAFPTADVLGWRLCGGLGGATCTSWVGPGLEDVPVWP